MCDSSDPAKVSHLPPYFLPHTDHPPKSKLSLLNFMPQQRETTGRRYIPNQSMSLAFFFSICLSPSQIMRLNKATYLIICGTLVQWN